jgi:hypothetical protein
VRTLGIFVANPDRHKSGLLRQEAPDSLDPAAESRRRTSGSRASCIEPNIHLAEQIVSADSGALPDLHRPLGERKIDLPIHRQGGLSCRFIGWQETGGLVPERRVWLRPSPLSGIS